MNENVDAASSPLVPVPIEIKDFTPVGPLERIETIDILRGFALLGVLIANMKGFSLPIHVYFGFGGEWPLLTPLDKAVDLAILFLVKEKFISLFSFLFGLGLAVQLSRAEAKGVSVVRRYTRRLVVLLMFGAAHIAFFWVGDVLHSYALVGFILILFRNLSLKGIARSFTICICLLILGGTIGTIVSFRNGPPDPVKVEKNKKELNASIDKEVQLTLHGTFKDQMRFRWQTWKEFYLDGGTLFFFTDLLALFLMGLYAGKRRIFQEVEQNRPFMRKCMWIGLACGIASSVMFLPSDPRTVFAKGFLSQGAGQFYFLFYAAGLTLLVHSAQKRWHNILKHLAPVGRMALSNYLSHTFICTTIFYGFGLGYFGKMGSAAGLLLSFAIFAFQIVFSAWWLSRFQFGPAEWVWRSLTYGKMQPMRVTADMTSPSLGVGGI